MDILIAPCRELDRLRDLLRQHGIEPDGGTAKTA